MPEYAAYQCKDGLSALRRVLVAYAMHDPELGYCQAMNIVAAVLLIYVDESWTFWILQYFCHRILPGYYSTDMHGAVLDQKVLDVLVCTHIPRLWKHLNVLEIQLSVATLGWFLTLFIGAFQNLSMSLRVLDSFFLDGTPFLFQFALGILRELEQKIVEEVVDEGALVKVLKEFLMSMEFDNSPRGSLQELLAKSHIEYQASVTSETIEKLREKHSGKIVQEAAEYAKKIAVRDTLEALQQDESINYLSNQSLAEAISYFYDVFNDILFYHDPRARFSFGLDSDGFLKFLERTVAWAGSGQRQIKKRSLSNSVLKFCLGLFRQCGKSRNGRISFEEVCSLLLRLTCPDASYFCNCLYFCFATEDGLEYSGLIAITEVLIEMINSKVHSLIEEDERLSAILSLLKMFPVDARINHEDLLQAIQQCPPLVEFISSGICKTIFITKSA